MPKPLWEVYPRLVDLVREDHRKQGALFGTGHGFDHAIVTAQYCPLIAPPELADPSWMAAICHNPDRLFPEESKEQIRARVEGYLQKGIWYGQDSLPQVFYMIVEAVMEHPNWPSPEDNPVTIILKDADKLGNLDTQVLVRAGQFRPQIPMIDLRYLDPKVRPPGTSFPNPGSIWWDMQGVLEWEGNTKEGIPWIRTPKARELAKPMFAEIRRYTEGLERPYRNLGLLPYPWPDDFDALKA